MSYVLEEVLELPAGFRAAYLDELRESQELFVEGLVERGQNLVFSEGGQLVGYAVVQDRAVVELHAHGDRGAAKRLLCQLLVEGYADRAIVKSFDAILVEVARSLPARAVVLGHLFRAHGTPEPWPEPSTTLSVRARVAQRTDVEAILQMHDGFFDNADEVERYVERGGLVLHCSPDGEVLACGLYRPVLEGRDAMDVGMVVSPRHRRMGLGAMGAADAARRCVAEGRRPIAGCGADNVASRSALLRAGFVETDALLEIRFDSTSELTAPTRSSRPTPAH